MEEKINQIKNLLLEILSYFENINDENFKMNLDNSLKNMEIIDLLKKELRSVYGPEQLKDNETMLIELTKLIQKKFDNIVRLKKEEAENISNNLKQIQNQKKITNYIR
ncbi:MAG TPA: hypothetical protein VMT35_14585 [Ignavibacteriaceae bacterium]|nr:hypothetical protein [Ignavibacteriaceae bacterium]